VHALNGPIYHRQTLIRLRWPLLPLSRLSKFAFLTASLGTAARRPADRPLAICALGGTGRIYR